MAKRSGEAQAALGRKAGPMRHRLEPRGGARNEDLTEEHEGGHNDYPTEPIGGGNPYYRCVHCKVSDPEINGRIGKHRPWCEYRASKEIRQECPFHPETCDRDTHEKQACDDHAEYWTNEMNPNWTDYDQE